MCISSALSQLYESRRQKKAASKALRQSRAAAANAQNRAEAERQIASAQQAAESQALDAGDATELSLAKRRHGVSATFLNGGLNESLGV